MVVSVHYRNCVLHSALPPDKEDTKVEGNYQLYVSAERNWEILNFFQRQKLSCQTFKYLKTENG